MDVWTTFTREDYTRVLVEQFGLDRAHVEALLRAPARDELLRQQPRDDGRDARAVLPGAGRRVKRLLMEPIAYANGSTLDDPAITYGIVFSNFMGSGSTPSAAGRTC
jgi:all-trans-retinol 13,14-reductase